MKQVEVLETLESAASTQWGIITTAQAKREGVTRLQIGRLADKDVLTRARRGIYLLPSAQYGSLTDIRIAWVSLDTEQFPDERWENKEVILVSHESAAFIHHLGDLIPQKNTFSSTFRKQTTQADIYIYSNREISSRDVSNIDGLPVTSVEKTVVDLAEKKIEFNYLASIVVDALRKENIRLKSLSERLNEAAQLYGFSSGLQLVLACKEEAEADDDWEETIDRYLSSVKTGWIDSTDLESISRIMSTAGLAGIGHAADLAKHSGATGVGEQIAKYAKGAGAINNLNWEAIIGAASMISVGEQIAKYAKGAGAINISGMKNFARDIDIAGLTASFDSLSAKNLKKRPKNADKEPSGGSHPSVSNQGHTRPEKTDRDSDEKETP